MINERLIPLYETLIWLYENYGGAENFLDGLDELSEMAIESGYSRKEAITATETVRSLTKTYINNKKTNSQGEKPMNSLITINYNGERPTVSGRELHKALGVGTEYRHWFPRMCEYGFKDGKDYTSVIFDHPQNKQSTTDHKITIQMAKELCMLQRTAKGKQFREYFISCEEAWNSPEKIMERALQIAQQRAVEAEKRIFGLTVENEQQKQIIGELKPVVDYVNKILASTGTMATTQIAADYGITANKLNKILQEERIQRYVGKQWILYREHMNKGYTKSETIPITRSDGRPDTKLFTKWTQKGRLMINEVLNKRGIYANMDLIVSA